MVRLMFHMDATLKKNSPEASGIMQAAVYDRGKSMQDPPIAGKSVLVIDEQPMFWTQPMV